MTWGNYLFSFSGRINRAKLWLFVLLVFVVNIVLFTLFALIFGFSSLTMVAAGGSASSLLAGGALAMATCLLMFAVIVAMFVAGIALATKRLHDRNKSAAWLLVFYVLPVCLHVAGFIMAPPMGAGPQGLRLVFSLIAFVITIWAFVELYCLRGTVGDNRYGPDPLAGKA